MFGVYSHTLYTRRSIDHQMAFEKNPVIMFVPHYLKDGFGFLSFFYAIKKPTSIDFIRFSKKDIQAEFGILSQTAYSALISLTDEALANQKNEFIKALGKNARGREIEDILLKKIIRNINDTFYSNFKEWKKLPWYHQTKDPIKKSLRKGPCSLEAAPVSLHFKVIKHENNGLELEKFVTIGKLSYQLSDFTRTLFLIDYKNQYFILAHTDYLTLEMLDSLNIKHLAFNTKDFFIEIVKKLEAKGYVVDRNHCFPSTAIQSLPVGRILISEISNTFLQFIPTFSYDGILIEGAFVPSLEVERQGFLYEIERNKEKETEIIQLVKSTHQNFLNQFNNQFFISFSDAKKNNWFLKVYQGWLDAGIEIIGLDLLEHFRYSSFKIDTRLEWLSTENDKSTIRFIVSFGEEIIKIKELQKIIHSGQKSILLQDNTIGVFPDEWLLRYAVFLKHAKVIENHEVHINNRLLQWIDTPEIATFKSSITPPDWNEKWKAWQTTEQIIYPLAKTITASLRPYQIKGYTWLCLLADLGAGACLADDMGLGKTLQTICFIGNQLEKYPDEKQLIICPASLIYNWKAEFEKFAPGIQSFIFKTGIDDFSDFFNDPLLQIMICTYGAVRSNAEYMSAKSWGTIIVDESHNIKNPSAQITKAVHSLPARARVALSGTPVMNNTFDLYSQFEFLLPGFLGGPEFFKKEYADPIDKEGDQYKAKILHKITTPYILRRTKAQVAKDLPEKTVSILWCEMEEKQRAVYQEVKQNIKAKIFNSIKQDGIQNSKIGILAGIMQLKQVCCSPQLLEQYKNDTVQSSIKLNIILDELTNQLIENKVLVFSQFKGMLHMIANALRTQGIAYYHFDGDTKIESRMEMVNAFNDSADPSRVFLISLKAGNTGLNLTAADYVFLVDPWWNSSVEDQAIDRTHRIGQTKQVMAYKMICKDSIEERIIRMQEKKKLTETSLIKEDGPVKSFTDIEIDSLFAKSEDGFVKSLTTEDVEYLFE